MRRLSGRPDGKGGLRPGRFAGPMVPPHDLLQLTLDPHILFGEMLLGDADVPDLSGFLPNPFSAGDDLLDDV